MLECLGAEKAEISPVRAAPGGNLPAGCSDRPGWCWEASPGVPSLIHQAITGVEQGSGVLPSLQHIQPDAMDTPFLLTWEWCNRTLQPQGMEGKTPQPLQ